MSELESALFLFLEDVWANHELFGSCLYVQELLTADAWCLRQRSV